jgi:5-methylcytosine-specific restriction protein B
MASDRSTECMEALRLLELSRNVLISGPPGTGKSRLLAEVAAAFLEGVNTPIENTVPIYSSEAAVPIPPSEVSDPEEATTYPAASKTNRKVFRTVFHQNSKHRDFLTGIIPNVNLQANTSGFRIIKGTLYRASEHAKSNDGASLLIIDEINRGPAVQVFGGAIVAMEPDKRLSADGAPTLYTQFFEIMDPATGDIIEYALPQDLFILAAMNQADASVEPLDVAFMRRWEPFRLEPNEVALRSYYGLGAATEVLPEIATSATDVFEASSQAWLAINKRIALGRGRDFQIGHGVLMSSPEVESLIAEDAKSNVALGWAKILAHVEEVFFGDLRSIAATLNALDGESKSLFSLVGSTFADELRYTLEGPRVLNAGNIYAVLRSLVVN